MHTHSSTVFGYNYNLVPLSCSPYKNELYLKIFHNFPFIYRSYAFLEYMMGCPQFAHISKNNNKCDIQSTISHILHKINKNYNYQINGKILDSESLNEEINSVKWFRRYRDLKILCRSTIARSAEKVRKTTRPKFAHESLTKIYQKSLPV